MKCDGAATMDWVEQEQSVVSQLPLRQLHSGPGHVQQFPLVSMLSTGTWTLLLVERSCIVLDNDNSLCAVGDDATTI